MKRPSREHLSNPELLQDAELSYLIWLAARGAPPLAEDPVARMLGITPD